MTSWGSKRYVPFQSCLKFDMLVGRLAADAPTLKSLLLHSQTLSFTVATHSKQT